MSQVCGKCSHANPPDAIYCYFDGAILGGHAANGRRVQPGSQPFPSQFVFPSGKACGNFDQLAVACQENWASAVDLLKQGFLASFLGGLGRADLALAAKEAARFPDTDRGLDRLLAKLPSQVLESPKLRAEPSEVNLGVIPFGTNRQFELHLSNLGMRLLYGTVSSDCKWLTLGENAGLPQKLFQFGAEAFLNVQIRGQHLRAGQKTLEGHLLVESNGGQATITVRAEVPVKPYPSGVFAGAITPRQVAEKALSAPKDAAPLFESGAVAKWFASNGWIYPVQGPSASGVGGVQQFFEALGLAKPPKVETSQTALKFSGDVGQTLQATLELKTQEKRPVYAHAVCDQPWLDVSRAVLSGRNAVIHVVVPRVPKRPGDTLEALVTVTANGNQKFKVPVTLEVGGIGTYAVEGLAEAETVDDAIPVVQAFAIPPAGGRGDFTTVPLSAIPVADGSQQAAVAVVTEPASKRAMSPSTIKAAPVIAAPEVETRPVPATPRTPLVVRLAMHAVPAALLVFFLLLVLVHDILFAPEFGIATIDPTPKIAVYFDDAGKDKEHKDNLTKSMRFGVAGLPAKPDDPLKKLTFNLHGRSNSTLIRVADQTVHFGQANAGTWVAFSDRLGEQGGRKSVWLYGDKRTGAQIQVTQLVEIIPGEPIEDKKDSKKLKRFYDTCRVRYIFENNGDKAAKVGLRFLLDTLIGDNDGVPFTVPGQRGLVDKSANFDGASTIPDFIQVLENSDLKNPGVVAFLTLKIGSGVDEQGQKWNAEPPTRILLTRWPGQAGMNSWDIAQQPFGDDSAVVLYWAPKELAKGAKRELGFSYGVGNVSSAGGQLGVSVGGSFAARDDLTVVALVNNPAKGQTLTLKLPDGLHVVENELTQPVPPVPAGAAAQQTPVTWKIRADREGTYIIEVQSSTGVSQKKTITIKAKTIF